ncbi:hypothetical protein BWQ96_10449 [Gracilariopsis chorda]|uniref:Uncharacterized protein n=1 Tax=Gracilariopsis chorda TaxID=448386 RepID=A0A2V3ICM4_9FLOR|nr:hypothetical protein BWQ96_10449 [Gracilariopsis chorda]|eukprot:PXF39839.1 hypothetical protein BWQ96_10449 [Gracilariopsis chorda]
MTCAGSRICIDSGKVFAQELASCESDQHDDQFEEIMRWVHRTADSRSWNVGGRRTDDKSSGGFGGGAAEASRLDAVRGERSERLRGSASSSRLLHELEEKPRTEEVSNESNRFFSATRFAACARFCG